MSLGQQRLPLPVGSPHAVRRRLRVFRSGPPLERTLISLVGMAAAVAGAVLTLLPPTTSVALDAGGYQVGDLRLEARGQSLYTGQGAALVIVEEAGTARAGASTHLKGERMVGACRTPAGGRSEHCWFQIGDRVLLAEDTFKNGGWDRRYEDGGRVRIDIRGGQPLPVPFPVGR